MLTRRCRTTTPRPATDAEPEYHYSKNGDTHDDKMYIGRVYGSDSQCHFGTWGVKTESAGEEFKATAYDLLMIPSTCAHSWSDPAQVTGSIPTQDENVDGAIAFCERSAVCAVADANGVWHPGYAIGSHRAHACKEYCQPGDCDGVCAGCSGCTVAGAPMGEGATEGGCGLGYVSGDGAASDDDALTGSQ